jgi:hypothetical protein
VSRGATVTWINRDDVPHTATSSASPRAFDSKALDTDERFSFVFTKPGTYSYFCAVQPAHDRDDRREIASHTAPICLKESRMSEQTNQPVDKDGIDRRGFLQCMAWVGTAVLWSVGSGGIVQSRVLAADAAAADAAIDDPSAFSFAQISDSHIGFSKEPNKDVTATLQLAVDRMQAAQEPAEVPAAHRRPHAPVQAGGV